MQPFTMAVPGADPPVSTVKTIGIPRSGSTTWLCRQLGRSGAAQPFLWAAGFFFEALATGNERTGTAADGHPADTSGTSGVELLRPREWSTVGWPGAGRNGW